MKTLTTQATINSFTNQGNENSIIHSAIAFINQIDFYNECLYRELVDKIQAALTEAIDNVVTFAYPNKQGKVCVSIFIYDKNVLKLKVRDWGRGIEDINKARTPGFTSEKEDHAGIGFTVMESFSDKLTVKSTLGKGTIVTMEFQM